MTQLPLVLFQQRWREPVIAEAGLDSLAKTHLVGEQRAFRKWRLKGEERRTDLMRVQVHLRAGHRTGKLLATVWREAARQLVGHVLGVVVGDPHARMTKVS